MLDEWRARLICWNLDYGAFRARVIVETEEEAYAKASDLQKEGFEVKLKLMPGEDLS